MLDAKLLRTDLDAICTALAKRGASFPKEAYESLESERKALQVETERYQNERNVLSKKVGQLKASGESAESVLEEVASIGDSLDAVKLKLDGVQSELNELLAHIPNVPHESVPEGKDENDNVEVRTWGTIPAFDFEPKEHYELGENLGGMDFQKSAKLTGSRYVVLEGAIARLHRALIQFMLDIHTKEHGYQEVYVPYIVNADSLYGTGQLPNLSEDVFKLEGETPRYLIPTAEVPVTNLVRDSILEEAQLPLRFCCHSPCFRSEAGSYGKDTKGMLRQHQFEKVELVVIAHPDRSFELHEELTRHAETILQRLNLPYRVVNLCGGDLGFSSTKTYDLEVWLPGQNSYREISSCSNFVDFQARRLKARLRESQGKNTHLVHTLNGSGLAVGRTLIAVLENYQTKDGKVQIPEALIPYMDGRETIG